MATLDPTSSTAIGSAFKDAKSMARSRVNPTSAIAHIGFITCLLLQRFGIPFGDGELSISVPVFFMLAIWMLGSGYGGISAKNAFLYLILAGWGLFCAFVAVLVPDSRVGFSFFSLLELLVLYGLMIVSPAGDFDGKAVQRIFLFYVRICAVAGIIQFCLQFAGIRLFSFRTLIPALDPWLLEKYYAWNPVLSYGSSILRSNGFFLLEPSIFSQVLGVAVLLDFFILGKSRYLPLYIAGYMVSYSGSGFLSLALTLGFIGLTSLRNSGRVIMFGIAAAIILALFSAIFPTQVATYLGRLTEFTSTNSSGHARYITPFQEIQAFKGETRNLIGYGPGATMRSRYWVANSGNSALQLFLDYGIIGLLLFYTFLVAILWRTRYAALSIILLINFELGGGYLLFAPIVLMMAALGVWSTGGASETAPAYKRNWGFGSLGNRRARLAKI